MPEFKDFAVYGDKLVFAQGRKNGKGFAIQIYRKQGSTLERGQFAKYKTFSESVFRYSYEHCPKDGVHVLVSADINGDDSLRKFREAVDKYMIDNDISAPTPSAHSNSLDRRYYDYCPFNIPLACSQKAS